MSDSADNHSDGEPKYICGSWQTLPENIVIFQGFANSPVQSSTKIECGYSEI